MWLWVKKNHSVNKTSIPRYTLLTQLCVATVLWYFLAIFLKYDIDTYKEISYAVFYMVINISFGLDSSSLLIITFQGFPFRSQGKLSHVDSP